MHRRDFIKTASLLTLATLNKSGSALAKSKQPAKNIILIFTDDQGYADLGCYGAEKLKTPNIDALAKNGMKFTSFYAQPICGPSRAALMTGSYPMRIAEKGNKKSGHTVPHPREIFISELLKGQGYSTACLGKWHLGWQEGQRPWEKGFDYFYGTPYYNGYYKYLKAHENFTCTLFENSKSVAKVDTFESMGQLTKKYTEKAVDFIDNAQGPFFLYLAHNMPHIPLGASKEFLGQSEMWDSQMGLYGDVIEELDWSVGEVVNVLKRNGLEKDTLVVFASDNGPWIEAGRVDEHGGSAKPLKGSKMTTWEGGFRVPCIMYCPGFIETDSEFKKMASTMDLYPTFAAIAGCDLSNDIKIDGRNLLPVFNENSHDIGDDTFYYYLCTHLQAVRKGKWKLVMPREKSPAFLNNYGRLVDQVRSPMLFDLSADKEEQHDLAQDFPAIVKELNELYNRGRERLGDYDRIGTEQRFFEDGPKRSDIQDTIR
jgi:arylsulfatase A-like enzyme